MSSPILTTHELICGYKIDITPPLDLVVNHHDIVAILGVNGRGKSTLLKTLMGIIPPFAGKIDCVCQCGFVPQNFSLNIDYQVWEVVVMGRSKQWGLFGKPNEETKQLAYETLTNFGLKEHIHRPFSLLSGGQKQLVLIARALLTQCEILLLDEPTTALDLHNQQKILNLLTSLAMQHNLTIIFSTHDPAHAMYAANQVLLLQENNYQYGKTEQFLTESNLSQLYHISMKKITLENSLTIFPIYHSE